MHRHDPRCDHCFRSSKPRLNLAEQSVFSGLAACRVAPACLSLSLFRSATIYFGEPFQPSTGATLKPALINVNAAFRCNRKVKTPCPSMLQVHECMMFAGFTNNL